MGVNRPSRHARDMTSLHITHTVRDFDEWYATFQDHEAFRAQGGVTGLTVRRSADDPNRVAVDLEFDGTDEARAFLGLLETRIWPTSPHLDSAPVVQLLEVVGVQDAATP